MNKQDRITYLCLTCGVCITRHSDGRTTCTPSGLWRVLSPCARCQAALRDMTAVPWYHRWKRR